MNRASRSAVLASLLVLALVGGCKNRRNQPNTLADLSPPKNAPAWESRYAVAFDDAHTPTAVNLQGRAPNDVLDQQLFQARLGHAAIVVMVDVEQVWGKGRYQGRQDQYLELQIGEVLLGTLPKDAPERIMIEVSSSDDLPGSLKGESMLLFLRWDAESEPPFHHHLMPADDELVALIKAMVKHAQAEGVLDGRGDETKAGKRKSGKRKSGRKGRKQGNSGDVSGDPDLLPATDTPETAPPIGTEGTLPETANDHADAPKPPPADGPTPDSSTGLDKLDDEPASAPPAPE